METPKKIEISFEKDEDIYILPSNSYGICENKYGKKECYIYSMLGENKDIKLENKLSKK